MEWDNIIHAVMRRGLLTYNSTNVVYYMQNIKGQYHRPIKVECSDKTEHSVFYIGGIWCDDTHFVTFRMLWKKMEEKKKKKKNSKM